MVNAYIKLQIGNRYYRNIFIIIISFLLTSCGTPTTVVKRGQVSEIDKERVIIQGIALDTYYKRLEKLRELFFESVESDILDLDKFIESRPHIIHCSQRNPEVNG